MKLAYRDIESFVKQPSQAVRVILVYGPDDGLMRERAKTMAMTVVSDYNDPFNVAVISSDILREDPARLNDEANAMSMMGGKRLVRVENADDKVTTLVQDYLKLPNDQAVIILEAGDLSTRSSLRKLCEKEDSAAAVPCYVEDERDLSRFIRTTLQEHNLQAENDAVSWLAANISGNRQKARGEIEKLITYKGTDKSPVTMQEVQECCGEAGANAIDDLIYSVAGNNRVKALQVYNQLLADGISFVVILRSLQNHFRRLHITKARLSQGDNLDSAMRSLNPPVFFKYTSSFKTQAENWRLASLEKVMERLMNLEADCKQTGAPVETLCAQAVLGIASMRG